MKPKCVVCGRLSAKACKQYMCRPCCKATGEKCNRHMKQIIKSPKPNVYHISDDETLGEDQLELITNELEKILLPELCKIVIGYLDNRKICRFCNEKKHSEDMRTCEQCNKSHCDDCDHLKWINTCSRFCFYCARGYCWNQIALSYCPSCYEETSSEEDTSEEDY